MTTSSAPSKPHMPTNRLRERFFAARWVLMASILVFGGLWITQRLPFIDAFLAFSLIFLAAIAVPRRARLVKKQTPEITRSEKWPDISVKKFTEALPDPCMIIDRRAVLRYRNRAAAEEFPSAAIGDPLAFSMRNPTLVAAIDHAIERNERVAEEFHETVPSENWYQVAVTPLDPNASEGNDDLGELMVVTITSQTQKKKHDQMRADFVANASHELRTPLTSLIGFLDTLRGPAAKDEVAREKFMGIMSTQAERMSRLIDDLLSLSRIELRQHVRPTDKVDLAAITKEVIELLQPQADEAKVSVSCNIDTQSAEVRGDRNELVQVMTNLIENAIKYGASGEKVEVTISPCTNHAVHNLRIDVRDYGPGIPAEHVPRLTERFYRVDAEISRKKKGTGLGLAIVKHIISRHRGELSIASKVNKGTTVSICF